MVEQRDISRDKVGFDYDVVPTFLLSLCSSSALAAAWLTAVAARLLGRNIQLLGDGALDVVYHDNIIFTHGDDWRRRGDDPDPVHWWTAGVDCQVWGRVSFEDPQLRHAVMHAASERPPLEIEAGHETADEWTERDWMAPQLVSRLLRAIDMLCGEHKTNACVYWYDRAQEALLRFGTGRPVVQTMMKARQTSILTSMQTVPSDSACEIPQNPRALNHVPPTPVHCDAAFHSSGIVALIPLLQYDESDGNSLPLLVWPGSFECPHESRTHLQQECANAHTCWHV